MLEFGIAAASFASALICALAITPVVIRLSWRYLALDRPDARKQHAGPIPRLGGVAVLAGFAVGVVVALWASGYQGTLSTAVRYHWIGWIGAITGLFLCGLVDDVRGLGPLAKLAVQIAAALAVYAAGFRIDALQLPGTGPMPLGWLSLPATLLWVVAVTNAINLIDGLDGLAAGVGFLITATVGAISWYLGVFPVTVIALALSGALLGFLPYNFSPARIFLGDSGSQFLGVTLAVISIRGLQKSATVVAILAPLLVLGLPILDTLLVVVRRTWRGGAGEEASADRGWLHAQLSRSRGLFQADREHIHHNLLELGLSHRRAVLVLYLIAAVFCAAAFTHVAVRDPSMAILVGLCVAAAVAGVKILAVRRRTYAPPRVVQSVRGSGGAGRSGGC
jgi:UDP-GlcNAc:undecaprenyl-phosphate GlcNAc-1-phosphate transferase